MFFRDRISNAKQNQSCLWAKLGDNTISPVASFVLGIHLKNSFFCDSRCPFGQIDNRKHILRRFRSNFQKMCWHVDLKRASRPFDCCKLELNSRCPFGQIDNRKHILGRFRSNFQKICWHVDLKRASRPFDCCKLDLMGHQWSEVVVILKNCP